MCFLLTIESFLKFWGIFDLKNDIIYTNCNVSASVVLKLYRSLLQNMSIFSYFFFFSILNDSIKLVIVKYIYSYSCNSIVSKKMQSSFIVYEHYIMLGLLVAQFLNFWQFFKFSKYNVGLMILYVITVKCIFSYSIHSIVLK